MIIILNSNGVPACMYVCICNGIKEAELRHLAQSGAETTEQAYAALGIQPDCAECVGFAQSVIDEELRLLAKAG